VVDCGENCPRNQSAIGTPVEGTTRFVMLIYLPDNHEAETVRDGIVKAMAALPAHLRKSLTRDQGSELARHKDITSATGLAVYFPHSAAATSDPPPGPAWTMLAS
jgi:transposase, IS30 family